MPRDESSADIPQIVTLCKSGCKPIWAGELDECPHCGTRDVRSTALIKSDRVRDQFSVEDRDDFDQSDYPGTNLLIIILSGLAGGTFLSQFGGTYAIVGFLLGIAASTFWIGR